MSPWQKRGPRFPGVPVFLWPMCRLAAAGHQMGLPEPGITGKPGDLGYGRFAVTHVSATIRGGDARGRQGQ